MAEPILVEPGAAIAFVRAVGLGDVEGAHAILDSVGPATLAIALADWLLRVIDAAENVDDVDDFLAQALRDHMLTEGR